MFVSLLSEKELNSLHSREGLSHVKQVTRFANNLLEKLVDLDVLPSVFEQDDADICELGHHGFSIEELLSVVSFNVIEFSLI